MSNGISNLAFQKLSNPGQTPPELAALGLSIVQDIEGVQRYKLTASQNLGGGFHQVKSPLWIDVSGDKMWIKRSWVPGSTIFFPYDLAIIREYILEAHIEYPDYKFPPIIKEKS